MTVSVECLIKRIGGSKVDLGDVEYHFRPETGKHFDPHVAHVADREHLACLLRIPEAYALAADFAQPVARDLTGSDIPKLDEFATLSDGAIADQFTQAFGSKPPKGFTRDLMITALRTMPVVVPSIAVTKPPKAAKAPKPAAAPVLPATSQSVYDDMTDDDLLADYTEVFGAEPAPDMDRAAMIAALKAVPKD